MLKINTIERNSVTIVEISGEVDLYSSPEVRKVLLELTGNKKPAIIINLKKVSYMDSSGVATLVEGLQHVGSYHGQFLLTNLRPEVKDVFDLSSLDKVFEIHGNLDNALKSIGSHGTHK